MGNTEKNPRQFVIAIIPARLFSTRLPGKLLLELGGKPLILHTLEQTKKAENIDRVIVATDSEEIQRVVKESGNEAVLTSPEHQSGSDRIAEVAEDLPENSIIVNVQGDEPLIPKSTIEKAVKAILEDETIDIATTCEPIEEAEDVLSPDVVKVITDKNNFALYFSRSPIPFPREEVKKHGSLKEALYNKQNLLTLYRKHTGLYVYSREYLLKYTSENQTNLEKTEMLEQLRALENGARIKVVEVSESSIGVDTQEDFDRVKTIVERKKYQYQKDDFSYRWANISDLRQVAEVYIQSSKKSYKDILPDEFLTSLSVPEQERYFRKDLFEKNYRLYVAENLQCEIIGYCEMKVTKTKTGYDAKLLSIYILPEYQRMGIGKELLNLVINELKAKGIEFFYLEALELSPFKDFYLKMGGKIVSSGSIKMAKRYFTTLIYKWENLSIV